MTAHFLWVPVVYSLLSTQFSVGIESAEDIIADLHGALEIAYAPVGLCAL